MHKTLAVAFSLVALSITAGCQQPVTPPQQSCPPAGTYVALNPVGSTTNPPTTATTFTDTPSGAKCYLAQGHLPAANGVIAQDGQPSNIVGPTTGGATGKVNLSVTCTAGSGQTCTGVQWVFFSASVVTALAPAQPSMGAPQSAQVAPQGPQPELAKNIPAPTLKVR